MHMPVSESRPCQRAGSPLLTELLTLGQVPGARCGEPAVQEVVPARQVLDQEGKVLRTCLWDPVVIDKVCGREDRRSIHAAIVFQRWLCR